MTFPPCAISTKTLNKKKRHFVSLFDHFKICKLFDYRKSNHDGSFPFCGVWAQFHEHSSPKSCSKSCLTRHCMMIKIDALNAPNCKRGIEESAPKANNASCQRSTLQTHSWFTRLLGDFFTVKVQIQVQVKYNFSHGTNNPPIALCNAQKAFLTGFRSMLEISLPGNERARTFFMPFIHPTAHGLRMGAAPWRFRRRSRLRGTILLWLRPRNGRDLVSCHSGSNHDWSLTHCW